MKKVNEKIKYRLSEVKKHLPDNYSLIILNKKSAKTTCIGHHEFHSRGTDSNITYLFASDTDILETRTLSRLERDTYKYQFSSIGFMINDSDIKIMIIEKNKSKKEAKIANIKMTDLDAILQQSHSQKIDLINTLCEFALDNYSAINIKTNALHLSNLQQITDELDSQVNKKNEIKALITELNNSAEYNELILAEKNLSLAKERYTKKRKEILGERDIHSINTIIDSKLSAIVLSTINDYEDDKIGKHMCIKLINDLIGHLRAQNVEVNLNFRAHNALKNSGIYSYILFT